MLHTTKTNTNCNFMLDDTIKPWEQFSLACNAVLEDDIKLDLTCEQMLNDCIKQTLSGNIDKDVRRGVGFKAYVNACRLAGRFLDHTVLTAHADMRDIISNKIPSVVPQDELMPHVDLSLSVAECRYRIDFYGLAFDYVQSNYPNKTSYFCNLRNYATGSLKQVMETLIKANAYWNGANRDYIKKNCETDAAYSMYENNFMMIPSFTNSPWYHEQASFFNVLAGQNLVNCMLLSSLASRYPDSNLVKKFISSWKSSLDISDETFKSVYLQFVDREGQDEKDFIKRCSQETLCKIFVNRANLMDNIFNTFFDRKYDKGYADVCNQVVESADEMLQGINFMQVFLDEKTSTTISSIIDHPLSADYTELVTDNMHFDVKSGEQGESN